MTTEKRFVRFDREDTVVVFIVRPFVAFAFWTIFLILFAKWPWNQIVALLGSYWCGVLACFGGFRFFVNKRLESENTDEKKDDL